MNEIFFSQNTMHSLVGIANSANKDGGKKQPIENAVLVAWTFACLFVFPYTV